MSKYVIVPGPADLRDADSKTPEAVVDTVTFAKAVHFVTKGLVASQQMDVLVAIDVRDRVNALQVGDILELSDDEYQAMIGEFKRPRALNAVLYGLGGGDVHIRAMVKATDKRPSVVVEKTDSKTEATNN